MEKNWRTEIDVHPAAEMFPLMTETELAVLAADIRTNDLREKVTLYKDEDGKQWLLDGRNRADALERNGCRIVNLDGVPNLDACVVEENVDPVAFVISKNIHRRHLTQEQKRDLIAELLKTNPEKSNRSIAAIAHTDHKTVQAVRADKESTGEILQLEATTGMDGKVRPAKKPMSEKTKNKKRHLRFEKTIFHISLICDIEIDTLMEVPELTELEKQVAVNTITDSIEHLTNLLGRVSEKTSIAA